MIIHSRLFLESRCFMIMLCIFSVTTGSLFGQDVRAESLSEAMIRAYQNNPTLQAARAKLRVVDETVPTARAAARPTVSVTGNDQRQNLYNKVADTTNRYNSRSVSLDVVQPLYKGGRIDAGINGAENRVRAERANLLSTEQAVLLSTITAYMDVLRDQAALALTINYQQVLRDLYAVEKRRLKIGENTRTDVNQAETRLAQSISDRIQAETTLRASISDFLRITGDEPGKLVRPKFTLEVSRNLDDIIETARSDNPDIVAARYAERAARQDVDAIDGELLPSLELVGNLKREWKPATIDRGRLDTASAIVRMTLSIDNGSIASRARGARQTVSLALQKVEEAERAAVDRASKSWNGLMAVRAQIVAREAMVRSIEETLESLRTEVNIGVRLLTDLLNAEQEALSARLALVAATHDETVISFTLLSAIGQLTAQKLKLGVDYYDYEAHYNRVRGKVWGVSLAGDPK